MMPSEGQLVKQEDSPPQVSEKSARKSGRAREASGNSRMFAKTGQWSQTEKKKYLQFLQANQQKLIPKDSSKMHGIFLEMSRWMKSRKVNQCRLYHQKMERYYQSVPAIIKYLSENLPSSEQVQKEGLEANVREFSSSQKQKYMKCPGLIKEQVESQAFIRSAKTCKPRRPSIDLPEEQELFKQEPELPKTDQSFQFLPSMASIHNQAHQMRPSFSYNFMENTSIQHHNSHLLLNNGYSSTFLQAYRPAEALTGLEQRKSSFFYSPFDMSQLPVGGAQRDWLQCHALFLAWQQKFLKILQRSKQEHFDVEIKKE